MRYVKKLKRVTLKVRRQKETAIEFVQEQGVRKGQKTEYTFGDDKKAEGKFILEEVPEGRIGWLKLGLHNTAFDENANLEMEKPVTLDLEISEKPEQITAMYLFSDWWTRPAFVKEFGEIPPRTQIAFLRYPDRYACLIPCVGDVYKTYLGPGEKNTVSLEMTAYMGGMSSLDEPVFLIMEDKNLYHAIEKAFAWLTEYKGIRKKEKRGLPEMFRYLGWCSWDAFYKEVDEGKIREKAQELNEKQVPVRWIMIDDGWLSADGDLLYDFAPEKKKFPQGFAKMTKEIRESGNVSWFGVWHALAGYWGGILPGSKLEQEERNHLYYTANGKMLPGPKAEKAFGFYRDWYELLRKEGIDFVKVDSQSAVKNHYENNVSVCRAARGIHQGLEGAASYFEGGIINCMGMAMENLLARPSSAVSRNSDDFCPGKEYGFAEHLLQNAYNTLYQDEVYYCDWDMFWTDHKDSIKHSLLRGISGGPVYFSDKIGETMPEVLKPLTYLDGRILMMERGVKPSCDCIFTDPLKTGVLKLTNVAAHGREKKGGGIAVYNLMGQKQEYTFSPADVWDISVSDKYWIYEYFNQTARICGRDEVLKAEIDENGFAWYQILVCDGPGAFLGLKEKYVGFAAVENMYDTEKGMTAVIREQGMLGFLSDKEPVKVICNGIDVSDKVEKKEWLYTVRLEEKNSSVIMEVLWE